jgi:hypothetical protein
MKYAFALLLALTACQSWATSSTPPTVTQAVKPYSPIPPVSVVLHDSYFTPVGLGFARHCFVIGKSYTHLEPGQTIPAKGDQPIWINTLCGVASINFTQGDPPLAQCWAVITGSRAQIVVFPGTVTHCTARMNYVTRVLYLDFNLKKKFWPPQKRIRGAQ